MAKHKKKDPEHQDEIDQHVDQEIQESHKEVEMTSEMIDVAHDEKLKADEAKPSLVSKIESDLPKHAKFSKFRGEK